MTVAVTAAALVLITGWITRPAPVARGACPRRSRSQRWVLALPIAASAFVSPSAAACIAGGIIVVTRMMRLRRAQRTLRRITTNYPEALDLLVLSIRAGYLPAQAIVEIVPHLPLSMRSSFAAVGDSIMDGTRFADAIGALSATLGPIAQPLVDSLSSADRYGLPLAPVLERLAFEARQQRRRDADAAARELPVRLAVPLVLCTLPSFVLLGVAPLLLGAISSLRR